MFTNFFPASLVSVWIQEVLMTQKALGKEQEFAPGPVCSYREGGWKVAQRGCAQGYLGTRSHKGREWDEAPGPWPV